jgi:hypothetical protein
LTDHGQDAHPGLERFVRLWVSTIVVSVFSMATTLGSGVRRVVIREVDLSSHPPAGGELGRAEEAEFAATGIGFPVCAMF